MPAPGGTEGTVKLVGAAFTANTDGPRLEGSPPELGEHNNELLRTLGYRDEEIAKLHFQGASLKQVMKDLVA